VSRRSATHAVFRVKAEVYRSCYARNLRARHCFRV